MAAEIKHSQNTIFLKLGGSLITDKSQKESPRTGVIEQLAGEVRSALNQRPELELIIGHGSGSYGHFAAKPYGTRDGVHTAEQWHGFAEVAAAAARLNRLVAEIFLQAGVPVISFQPSASARCCDGVIKYISVEPIENALKYHLVPLVFGDVAFDEVRGGTIISTEEIFTYLAPYLKSERILLAGEAPGVLNMAGQVIDTLRPDDLDRLIPGLGASHGVDVTGGMLSKVTAMLNLVSTHPQLQVRIFSGLPTDNLYKTLVDPGFRTGTLLSQ